MTTRPRAPRWLSGLWRSRRARPGLVLAGALLLFAVVGPLVLPDPLVSDLSVERAPDGGPPGASLAHPLGVDPILRDVLARLASGARVSLAIAIVGALSASTLGVLVGALAAGLSRGRAAIVDRAIVRLVDVLLALPYLLVVTAIGAALGKSDAVTLLAVLALVGWAGTARVARAQALVVLEQPYVGAARAMGAGVLRVALRHVLPNIRGLWIVVATGTAGSMILAEAVLGYLGVGLPPPLPTWGRMLHEAETLLSIRPLAVAAPGALIVLAVLACNRIGEGLRELEAARALAPRAGPRGLWDLAIAGVVLGAASLVSPKLPAPPEAIVAPATPTRGGTLRVASSVTVRALDPALAYDEASTAIGRLVWERLLEIDDDGRILPRLADRHAFAEDGRALTLWLSEGARFHDGERVTADDVKRSLERALHPGTPCPGASHFSRLVGFEDFRAGRATELSGVEVVSPAEVRFRLDRPSSGFLAVLSLGFAAPVCRPARGPVDPRERQPPCGAGPFRISEIRPEEGVSLARHEAYHRANLPWLDRVEWSFGVRSTAQRLRLERGDLDLSTELTPTDAALFQAHPGWAALAAPVLGRSMSAVFLNVEIPPFDRRDVRRAVRLALDPSVLPKIRPGIVPLDRVVPPNIPGAFREGTLRRHDLPAALGAMADAGLAFDPATGTGGWPDPIDYLTVGDSFEQATAEIWQQQLARIGLRLRLRTSPFPTYLAEVRQRGAAPMGWVGWGADFPDPLNFFEPTLSSRAIGDPTQNYAFFADPRLDDVLSAADRELDPRRRAALVGEAERIVHEEAPWVPTHASQVLTIRRPHVMGHRPRSTAPLPLEEIWLAGSPEAGAGGGR